MGNSRDSVPRESEGVSTRLLEAGLFFLRVTSRQAGPVAGDAATVSTWPPGLIGCWPHTWHRAPTWAFCPAHLRIVCRLAHGPISPLVGQPVTDRVPRVATELHANRPRSWGSGASGSIGDVSTGPPVCRSRRGLTAATKGEQRLLEEI